MPIGVFAAQETTTITFEEALEMALDEMLELRDMDIALRNLQETRREANAQVRRMENGEFRRELLQDLRRDLVALENEIGNLQIMQRGIDAGMQGMLGELTGNPAVDTEIMNDIMSMMMQSAGLDLGIIQMQAGRDAISEGIRNLEDDDTFREATREARHGVNHLDRMLEQLEMGQDQIRLALEFGLRSILIVDMELAMFIEYTEANLALAEQRINNMATLYELGMVSSRDITTAQNGLQTGRMHLDGMRRDQQTLRQSINSLLGQPLNQEIIIQLDIGIPQLPANFADQAETMATTVFSVAVLEMALDNAEDARWAYTGNRREIRITDADRRRAYPTTSRTQGNTINRTEAQEAEILRLRNRIELQENVERAEVELSQAIRSVEADIIRAYTEFTGLEAQMEGLNRNLVIARAELETVRINYNLGLTTQIALDEAELSILEIEQSITRLYNQMWQLAFRLENPDLL